MEVKIKDIYYRQNKDIKEYLDIFFDTNIGIIEMIVDSFKLVNDKALKGTYCLSSLDSLKEKYGELTINQVRITYDNNMYFLVSNQFIIAIEYILNSNYKYSLQEISFIENIIDTNKNELEFFLGLEEIDLKFD